MLVTITDTISIVSTSCSEMQRKYAEVAIYRLRLVFT